MYCERLSHIRENMYNVKISLTMPYRASNIKNANLNPREIANFLKVAKMYTRENITVYIYYDSVYI